VPVTHHRLDAGAMAARLLAAGLPSSYAQILAAMDVAIAQGAEKRISTTVEQVTGQKPRRFSDFARANAGAWRVTSGAGQLTGT
jgi:hypothetical protein